MQQIVKAIAAISIGAINQLKAAEPISPSIDLSSSILESKIMINPATPTSYAIDYNSDGLVDIRINRDRSPSKEFFSELHKLSKNKDLESLLPQIIELMTKHYGEWDQEAINAEQRLGKIYEENLELLNQTPEDQRNSSKFKKLSEKVEVLAEKIQGGIKRPLAHDVNDFVNRTICTDRAAIIAVALRELGFSNVRCVDFPGHVAVVFPNLNKIWMNFENDKELRSYTVQENPLSITVRGYKPFLIESIEGLGKEESIDRTFKFKVLNGLK